MSSKRKTAINGSLQVMNNPVNCCYMEIPWIGHELPTILMACALSGLVMVKYTKRPASFRYTVGSEGRLPSSLLYLTLTSKGISGIL